MELDPRALLALAVTLLALLALLAAEARELRPGVAVAKLLASSGFLAFALALGALDSDYGRIVLGALLLCWLGDLLLIPRGARGAFVAGLLSFLLGHGVFAAAFLQQGRSPLWMGVAAVCCAVGACFVARWLAPWITGSMRGAVGAYVIVISAMVACAAAATGAGAGPAPLLGAVAFAVSDLAVVRQRFVHASFRNKLWGLPLYYGAQLVLASSVAPGSG